MRIILLPLLLAAAPPLAAQSAAAASAPARAPVSSRAASAAGAPAASAAKPAASPAPGTMAPDFILPDQSGTLRRLRDLRGKNPVLIAFYPKDFTGGCTKELSQLRDRVSEFQKKNVAIFGLSLDDAASHQKFSEQYNLPFPLLVDAAGRTAATWGVLKTITEGGQSFSYAGRSLFLIGIDGKILFANPDFKLSEAEWAELFAAMARLPASN